jgi:hypothetical protein
MRSFFTIAALVGTLGTYAAASPAARPPTDPNIVRTGDAPTCKVVDGHTRVNYSPAFHTSFKCTHPGGICTCVILTNTIGVCKSVSHNGATAMVEGQEADCGPVTWTGSDLASDVEAMADGATIHLAAGTYAWKSYQNQDAKDRGIPNGEGICLGCDGKSKTITLIGAGKGATVLDAGGARRFCKIKGGTLVLRDLSMVNADHYGSGGAFNLRSGTFLDARNVEFKDNVARYGAVVFTDSGGTMSFTSCDFTGNLASSYGGVVYVYKGAASFTSCNFTNNVAVDSEGAVVRSFARGAINFAATLPANTFSGNTAQPGKNNNGNCWIDPQSSFTGKCSN